MDLRESIDDQCLRVMLMLPQLNKMLYIFGVLISRQGTAVISAFPAFIIHPWKKTTRSLRCTEQLI